MYKITEKTIVTENSDSVTMYGIENELESFDEITADHNEIVKLCNNCNALDLDRIHFKDVVEDFIASSACGIHGEKDL